MSTIAARTVLGSAVQLGDDLLDLSGRPHRIDTLKPYDTARVNLPDRTARIATSRDGWAITVFDSDLVQTA